MLPWGQFTTLNLRNCCENQAWASISGKVCLQPKVLAQACSTSQVVGLHEVSAKLEGLLMLTSLRCSLGACIDASGSMLHVHTCLGV